MSLTTLPARGDDEGVTTISGLPAHVLLVHAIVVLAPLTALLEILCGFVPAVRRRLVWLVLVLALVTLGLTPVTTEAGEWFFDRQPDPKPAILREHAERGGWMIYFSVAMAVVALLLLFLHMREGRSDERRVVVPVIVAILALAVGISTIITVYRIGDSGAHSAWGDALTQSNSP